MDEDPKRVVIVTYPKNLYRAIWLDGVATVYYHDHGETKIHPLCMCAVLTAEGEERVKAEGWWNTPQEAYNALTSTPQPVVPTPLASKG